MAQKTRFMDIYQHLREGGIDVYSPGQKSGECVKPYVVVKYNGGTQYAEFSSVRYLYDVMCYVPKDQYTQLEIFVDKVEKLMEGLSPMIKPTYFKTPSFYDDTVKGHMVSIQYKNFRKI